MRVAAVVVGAGRGERLGGQGPKALAPLLGQPLIARTLETLSECAAIDWIVPVVGPDWIDRYRALPASKLPGVGDPVPGGETRQDSVRAGLSALPNDAGFVAVHDAARCLVTAREVASVVAAARRHGAALLARPSPDTIKRVNEGCVVETPPRDECWIAQTPQVFRTQLLREALERALSDDFTGTDDAQLVERLGVPVHVVEGLASNLKITHPSDLLLAEAVLRGRGGG